ncbi:MAG: Rpn family recombination-promoting nuclease/putative transposase [Muribaculaceae bacterium]|nr:Rpn family recombination-promoting nuclease/putative transposase [Muribaculaceae bacterium]
MKQRFFNPFTDTGFKIVFGKEKDKIILISFLNALLEGRPFYEPITDVRYGDKEVPRDRDCARTAINDIHCITQSGRHIILEMQLEPHDNFEDRMICYSCRAVTEQMRRRQWDFSIESVYSICFTNFLLPSADRRLVLDRAYCDLDTREPVSDRQRYLYIQLPAFEYTNIDECTTELERWIYSLKHMPEMREIPFAARDEAFRRLQQVGQIESLSPEERRQYDIDQKQLSILYSIETSRLREGIKIGEERGRKIGEEHGKKLQLYETVTKLRTKGITDEMIANLLDIPVEKIADIR